MASVPYLTGGESPTADRMNTLFETFDNKLAKICANKSFVLAFSEPVYDNLGFGNSGGFLRIPPSIMANGFFFTDPTKISAYAMRCPGAIAVPGAPTGYAFCRPYDHTPFTNAANASTKTAFDTVQHIVTIDTVPSTFYTNGLTPIAECSLFDRSLEAHKFIRPLDGATYWMRETQVAQAEKRYKYAVAEIIIEGVNSVTLPDNYDKYNFFRIHNLNLTNATVHFGTSYSVTLLPLECKTVRRDNPTTNYRLGFRYFFKFEPGDYRHFWFWATSGGAINNYAHIYPSNSMSANNITNPAIVYDWIKLFDSEGPDIDRGSGVIENGTKSDIASGYRAAWFYLDQQELCDIYPLISSKFGDPSNSATIFGDLLHHKGKIKFGKLDQFNSGAGQFGRCIITDFDFNGYGSIITDFAAQRFAVTVVGGTYSFKYSDIVTTPSANQVNAILLPMGSNLWKAGEINPVSLLFNSSVSSFQIEKTVFDNQAVPHTLVNPSPRLVAGKIQYLTPDGRRYTPLGATIETLVAGPPILGLADPPAGTPKTLNGVHSVTIADLLNLSYFGDQALPTQDTNATTFHNPRLKFTPFGLVLLFEERVAANIFPPVTLASWEYPGGFKLFGSLSSGYFERPRIIKFRGHGWPHCEDGRKHAMFYSPRYGRHFVQNSYLDKVNGKDGKDFEIHSMGAVESNVKLLSIVSGIQNAGGTGYLENPNRRDPFWLFATSQSWDRWNALGDFEQSMSLTDFQTYIRTHLSTVVNAPWTIVATRRTTYPLLPEHYNGMAQMVNQCKKGKALDGYALRFVYAGGIKSLQSSAVFQGSRAWIYGIPVPVDTYDCWTGAAASLYQSLGIPVYDSTNFPADYAAAASAYQVDRTFHFDLTATVSGVHNYDGPDVFEQIFFGEPAHTGTNWYAGQIDVAADLVDVTYANAGNPGIAVVDAASVGFSATIPVRIDLNNDYATFNWVKISDVKSFIEGLGMTFIFENFFRPLKLSVLKSPRSYETGEFDNRNVTFAERLLAPRAGAWSTPTRVASAAQLAQPSVEFVAFEYPSDPSETTWKFIVRAWSQSGSAAYDTVHHRRAWKTKTPDWMIAQLTLQLHYVYPITTDLGMTYLCTIGAPPLSHGAPWTPFTDAGFASHFNLYPYGDVFTGSDTGPFVHIEFTPANPDEEDLLERQMQHSLFQRKVLAFQSANSAAATSKARVLLAEKQFWATPNDWWEGDIAAKFGDGFENWLNIYQNYNVDAAIFPLASTPVSHSRSYYASGYYFGVPNHPQAPWESAIPVSESFRGKILEMTNGPIQFIEADPPEDGVREHGTEFNVVQELVNILDL